MFIQVTCSALLSPRRLRSCLKSRLKASTSSVVATNGVSSASHARNWSSSRMRRNSRIW